MKNIKLTLSPLAGVTDASFRCICNDHGLDYAYTEMVSAKGLLYSSKNSFEILDTYRNEKNIGVQIFGSEPEVIENVIKNILNKRQEFDSIDLNMGCPAPKIVKNGEGSALMKNPELVKKIIYTMKNVSNKPVSAKFRLGFDDNSINYMEIGKICQSYGADKVTLHPRTRKQMYSGKADWDAIRQLRSSLHIQVCGNGDIFTPEDAINMVEYTGVDEVAIARGAMGNPYIFEQVKSLIKNGAYDDKSLYQVIETIKKHYELILKFKPTRVAANEMRKHMAWYLKGFRQANAIKKEINITNSKEEAFELLDKFLIDYKGKNEKY